MTVWYYAIMHLIVFMECYAWRCVDLNDKQRTVCNNRSTFDEIQTCPDKPTIFLIGPTRNGKSFYSNLLLNYANDRGDDETEEFESNESEISVTSSIKCICGDKYRVCDSPGIPDICGKADEYLDRVVNFMKRD
eukprot:157170_1